MDYLFFDLECSDGVNICSFGYVLCDEELNVIESKDIVVNPRARFFSSKVREKVGFDLAYTEKQFKSEPDFKHYYPLFKQMLTEKDRIVVGHAARNDAGFIRHACEKYSLDYINYDYVDTQAMFRAYANIVGLEGYSSTTNIALDDLSILLGLGEFDNMHRSDADAMATYRCFKQMAINCNAKPTEFIEMCRYCTGGLRNGELVTDMPERFVADEDFGDGKMTNRNRNIIRRFITRYHPDESVEKIYADKEIAFSRYFESGRAKDMVKITARILDRGGKINYDLKLADIFVTARNQKGHCCSRYNYSKKIERETGKKFRYITAEDFLVSLGIGSMDELSSLPMPVVNLNGPKYKPREIGGNSVKSAKPKTNAQVKTEAKTEGANATKSTDKKPRKRNRKPKTDKK
ncbi:MAG: hypothetical protein IKC64_00205 [Clostridia bacterium]|nr:hypothetical protein [Clostridia bacterium]